MELLNERNQIRTVANRWRAQYGAGTYANDKRKSAVGDELSKLGAENATADDVAEIIGNRAWVEKSTCNECGKETWDAVRVGEPEDYESRTATICIDCLKAAVKLVTSDRKSKK